MLSGMEWQWKHAGLERHRGLFSILTLLSEENWDCNPLKVLFHADKVTTDFWAKASQWQSKHREQNQRERLPAPFFCLKFSACGWNPWQSLANKVLVKGGRRFFFYFHVGEGVNESRKKRKLFNLSNEKQQVDCWVEEDLEIVGSTALI